MKKPRFTLLFLGDDRFIGDEIRIVATGEYVAGSRGRTHVFAPGKKHHRKNAIFPMNDKGEAQLKFYTVTIRRRDDPPNRMRHLKSCFSTCRIAGAPFARYPVGSGTAVVP